MGRAYLSSVPLVDNLLMSVANISRPQSRQINQSSELLRFRLIAIPSFQQGIQIRPCFSGGSLQQNGFEGSALLVVWQMWHCEIGCVSSTTAVDTLVPLPEGIFEGVTV